MSTAQMTRAHLSPLRTMTPPAHTFRTITDADWAAELRRARAQGAAEGNELLRRIRAAALAADIADPELVVAPITQTNYV